MSQDQLGFARKLRREMSAAEAILWRALRGRSIKAKFRRQMPMGPYVANFVCVEAKLVIEVDGPAHREAERQQRDERRDVWFGAQGWRVLRFAGEAVTCGCDSVMAEIEREISRRPSSDLASRGHLLPLSREKDL